MFFPEQEYKISNKSEDELKKLTLEENMTETQRASHILTRGQQLQKRAIYVNLHRLLREHKAFETLFPLIMYQYIKLSEEVQQQEEENQIIAAKSLKRLLQENRLPENYLFAIFQLTQNILKIWSLPVLEPWIELMDRIVVTLPACMPQIQQLVLLLTDVSQPTVSRQSACRLIGTLAEMLQNKIKGPIFDRARQLCSDHDKEVRLVMAEQVMVRLCLSITTDLIETYLLEKIFELYYDTDFEVKCAGMKLFYSIAHQLSPEELKNRCVKLFLDQIQSQNEDSKILMSHLCGRVYNLIKDHVDKSERSVNMFLQIYKDFAKQKNPLIRQNFALNLPAILSLSQKKFEFFQDSLQLCANDQNDDVVRSVISAFHEIVLLSETNEILVQMFVQFLKSKNVNILEILVFRYSQIVNSFQKHQQPFFGLASLEMLNHLLNQNLWDLQAQFNQELMTCHQVFTDLDSFVNALMNAINKGTPKTKRGFALNITQYLSKCPDLRKRNISLQMLAEVYKKSESCFQRMTYLDLVEGFSSQLSRKLFKELKFFNVLELAKDPVINVRIKLIKLLPILRQKIEADDEEMLTNFNNAVQLCLSKGSKSFQQVILMTKELLLQSDNEADIQIKDLILQQQEENIIEQDTKQRQLELDQEKDDLDFNRTDFNDYLSKYRKKFPLSKMKMSSVNSQIIRKEKAQLSGSLYVKKSIDYDSNRSPLFEPKKPLLKAKTPMTKSVTEVKKQFKLPSIKK